MSVHGPMGLGGGPLRAVWEQRRSLGYLEEGSRPTKETARRVLGVLRPHAGKLLVALGLTLLGVLIGLVPPLLMRQIIDVGIVDHNLKLIYYLAAGLVLFPAARAITAVGQNYLNAVVSLSVVHDLRTAMYEHGQRLGIDFFTRTPGGEIHSRLVNDLNSMQQTLNTTMTGPFVNALTIIFTLATMVALDWRLALLSALVLPAFALPVLSFGRRTYDAVTHTQEALSHLTAHLEETLTLSGIIVVKSFGTRQREADRFRDLSRRVRDARVKQSMIGQWLVLVVSVMSALGPALLYGYGGYLIVTAKVQLGTIVAFSTYLVQLYNPASSLAGSNTTLIGGLALFDRIFRFLDAEIDVREPAVPAPFPAIPGITPVGLEYADVHFSYRKDEETLHGISFTARPGELTAVVGPSGAGKSTILFLGARFYDPAAGDIRLNGVSLPSLDEATLRRLMSVVTQELFLFHTTLEDNIRYGRPDAAGTEVAAAVEAAQLGELVASLPAGLQTIVGERGYRLSGGEKQRVAIARAILRNPSVLLLDEATSSLDSHVERLIQEALARLFRGRTVIAIAHRLSTILAADQILVVNGGQVAERGRHADLLAHGGLYARLYHEQFDPGQSGPGGSPPSC
ncbi:MAG TPA: ABC transporter ATP-binding protein [Spirochaetia bacterium]|nr:ABC transporter ATP-binding protein [Spirochaetia bacterium]